jgi:hypothetical protein
MTPSTRKIVSRSTSRTLRVSDLNGIPDAPVEAEPSWFFRQLSDLEKEDYSPAVQAANFANWSPSGTEGVTCLALQKRPGSA